MRLRPRRDETISARVVTLTPQRFDYPIPEWLLPAPRSSKSIIRTVISDTSLRTDDEVSGLPIPTKII